MVGNIIQFLCLEWSISVFYKLCSDVCSGRDVIQDNDDDLIHMGHAIVTFYSALIDLLGRCAPEMHVSVFSMSAAVQHSLMPDSIELSREKPQLPFCQLHNWKKIHSHVYVKIPYTHKINIHKPKKFICSPQGNKLGLIKVFREILRFKK